MRKLLPMLSLVILFTFAGGFYSGVVYKETESVQSSSEFGHHFKRSPQLNLSAKEIPEIVPDSPKVLMGYVQDYQMPGKTDYSQLSHVLFSFAHPTESGGILLSGDHAWDNLRQTVKLAHEQNAEVLLAVGGWFHMNGGKSYPYFRKAISNETSRTKLVNELVKLVKQEDLDGVDIDFEHPRSQEDAQFLASFIKELKAKLEMMEKELSTAVYSKVDSVTGQENKSVIFLPSMFEAVDYVNIMAYDGQWDGGYDAANLSPYPFTENIVQYWSQLFELHGIPKDKLVLGVPFYAQPDDPSKPVLPYSAIVKKGNENALKDSVAVNGVNYYYNGRDTIRKKTDLALANDYGGMMIWEAGHDAQGENSLTRIIRDVLKQEEDKEGDLFWEKN
ncbi:chitinase [Bacillus salacetis]|uniref:chitinase n=1 Tax=Bacillus salacetis TaxID=2315464 RepID=A0A3A1R664_9BACI|nr:glycoside hydrolase family 18 protein [Bacillus salacetis]RIW38318.1 chitinase [Bacillus salacetis]